MFYMFRVTLWSSEVGEMFHPSFIELLLEQCERNVFSFRGSDVLHLCLALSSLVRSQNGDIIPSLGGKSHEMI